MAPKGNENVKFFIQQAFFKRVSEFPYIKFNYNAITNRAMWIYVGAGEKE